MENRTQLATEHLLLRLEPLNRALAWAVERQGLVNNRLLRADLAPLCVTADQVGNLLADVEALVRGQSVNEIFNQVQTPIDQPQQEESEVQTDTSFWRWAKRGKPKSGKKKPAPDSQSTPDSHRSQPPENLGEMLAEELQAQEDLRNQAEEQGLELPLDQLSQTAGLTEFEIQALLLVAAPELDRSYERIYAFILDDLNRRFPCVELLCALTANTLPERLAHRLALGRFGRLRRLGLLQAWGESPTEGRQELRLGAGVLEYLLGESAGMGGAFHDPVEIIPKAYQGFAFLDQAGELASLAKALAVGQINTLGLWGSSRAGVEDVVMTLASHLDKPLRRLPVPDSSQQGQSPEKSLQEAILTAVALDAVLWLESDSLQEPSNEKLSQTLLEFLSHFSVPLILTGALPWRPTQLLETRAYAEIELKPPGFACRRALWEFSLPGADEAQLDEFSARYRLSPKQLRAALSLAQKKAEINGQGDQFLEESAIEEACALVARRRSHQFANLIIPKRQAKDLILPEPLHQQVLEVAQFFQDWPKVAESWGFGRMETGYGGVKALFTGDSGTGKTLAAEIIAGKLAMPLLKVDLARVVSKWVGETEKHLEAAFREAEDSHTVLFFDECDALFGKRGEVEHGVDRYANLEVSYLLQRLEYHEGLVILASNLKDNIDPAFNRRFQIILNFPRPMPPERAKIWALAFPNPDQLEAGIDFNILARLDMTGAGIVGAARTAALLAAGERSPTINRSHLARAIARQFHRESRILSPIELGPYAVYLKEAK